MAGSALGGGRPLLDILTVPGVPKAPYYYYYLGLLIALFEQVNY